ncbi:hypothetical protein P692DRAFT_20851474 [Suillus brevipes Sb2]|nr:hypothetical protein P692DRAFT_20851474 [Suillus brevipes Sb2]
MSSSQADSNIVDCTDSVDFRNNVIIMEVDNLLVGWPAYKIKFTPKNPDPIKLIICLKDAVKFMHVEESTDSEAELLFSSNGRKRARKNKKIKTSSAIEANTIMNALAALKITSTSSDSTSFHAKPRPPAPVRVALKPKFSDNNIPWPPIQPHRALRDIKMNEGTNLFKMVKTIPAAVAPDNTYT